MVMSRSAKITFTTWCLAAGLFTFGKLAFQEKRDNPGSIAFAFAFTNSQPLSPWERLQVRQRECRENLLMRQVPVRADGDAIQLIDACMGDRVMTLREAGGRLNPLQNAVYAAARVYKEQKRYYYLSAFFIFVGAIPILHSKITKYWTRSSKMVKATYYYVHDIIKKMS